MRVTYLWEMAYGPKRGEGYMEILDVFWVGGWSAINLHFFNTQIILRERAKNTPGPEGEGAKKVGLLHKQIIYLFIFCGGRQTLNFLRGDRVGRPKNGGGDRTPKNRGRRGVEMKFEHFGVNVLLCLTKFEKKLEMGGKNFIKKRVNCCASKRFIFK